MVNCVNDKYAHLKAEVVVLRTPTMSITLSRNRCRFIVCEIDQVGVIHIFDGYNIAF